MILDKTIVEDKDDLPGINGTPFKIVLSKNFSRLKEKRYSFFEWILIKLKLKQRVWIGDDILKYSKPMTGFPLEVLNNTYKRLLSKTPTKIK